MKIVPFEKDKKEWNKLANNFDAHPMQLWGWGELKSQYDWSVKRFVFTEDDKIIGGVQLLIRKLPKPFDSISYVPRGPFYDEETYKTPSEFMYLIADYVKKNIKSFTVEFEPNLLVKTSTKDGKPIFHKQYLLAGRIKKSSNTYLMAKTMIIDLTRDEDEILADMRKKCRQYIRKSNKVEGMEIKHTVDRNDIQPALEIYKETAKRANFPIHDDEYYYKLFDILGDESRLYIGCIAGKPEAFLWLQVSKDFSFELYGGVTDIGQKNLINYALKWYAMQDCKAEGISEYDLNGLLNDGILQFKLGFSNHEDYLMGTKSIVLSKIKYWIWTFLLPKYQKIRRAMSKDK